jgi:hypothetical protein
MKLKELRDQMDRLNRTDSSYLKLFTQEHDFLNLEKISQHDYKLKESEERDLFFRFSALLRESQEKERARAERIKYLQLSLSIACTFLGLLSALLISFLRRTEIKEILNYEKETFNTLISKLDVFEKEQLDLNQNFKVFLATKNENSSSDEFLSKQNKFLVENLSGFEKTLNKFSSNNNNYSESKNFSELDFSRNLNRQQDFLKLISVTTVLSTFFLCIMYFKGN